MKKLIALFLFVAASLSAQETLDLGPHGKLTLYLLGDWQKSLSTIGRGTELTIVSTKESTNAKCQITVTIMDKELFDTKTKLKNQVEVDGEGFAQQVGEAKPFAKPLNVATGYGFACEFTDPALKGKPVKPGDYKVVTVGKIRINAKVLLDVFIGSEGFNTEAHQQLLGALEGMEYRPGR